jgi:transposase
MYTKTGFFKEEVIKQVISGEIKYKQAARQLNVTSRTIQNYCSRFLKEGPKGLRDRRSGNHYKLSSQEEAAIVGFKLQRPNRSARLIRDRLRLGVSEEAVRLILVKHQLNGTGATAYLGQSPLSI